MLSPEAGAFICFLLLGGFVLLTVFAYALGNSQQKAHEEFINTTKGIAIGIYRYGDGRYLDHSWGTPNSVGGWSIRIVGMNCTGKTINYCTFKVHTIDAVGGLAYCEIKHCAYHNLRGTGPIMQGGSFRWQWDDFCYVYNLNKIILDSVYVEYADGTAEDFPASTITWETK